MSKPKSELVKFNYKKLRQRIFESGLTRREVAKKSGCLTKDGIAQIINNEWNPWASQFLRINKTLRCSMRDMVELENVTYRELPETLDFSGNRLSYQPLRDFLASFNKSTFSVLINMFDKDTAYNFSMDRDVNMKTIAKICKELRIPPDHVMKLV